MKVYRHHRGIVMLDSTPVSTSVLEGGLRLTERCLGSLPPGDRRYICVEMNLESLR